MQMVVLVPEEIAKGVSRTLPLREFVERMEEREAKNQTPLVVFDTMEFARRAELLADAPALPHFDHWALSVPCFTWSPAGLGLPFHKHAANFLAQIIGRKTWFMFPANLDGIDGSEIEELNEYFNKIALAAHHGHVDGFDAEDVSTWPMTPGMKSWPTMWDPGQVYRGQMLTATAGAGDIV